MKKRISVKISGFVQGVFYRSNTQELAEDLNLTGFVKNQPDGTVFAIAEGEEENLKEFVKDLKKGPKSAKVDKVKVSWQDATDEFDQFNIKY